MPKKNKNIKVVQARESRNERIRHRFAELYNRGLRYEIVMERLIDEYGLAEATISQIVNCHGAYKKKS